MFTRVTRELLLVHIMRAEATLKENPPQNLLHALEARFTLNCLKVKFEDPAFDEDALIAFFNLRWTILQGTDLQYCHDLLHPGNQAFVRMAHELASLLNRPYLTLLMPTLLQVPATSYTTSSYDMPIPLSEIVLNELNDRIIHIPDVLDAAQEDGILKHNSLFDGRSVVNLSQDEIQKIMRRDVTIEAAFQALKARIDFRINGDTVGATVRRLIDGLREGGQARKGTDSVAGTDSTIAISNFFEYLETLSDEVRAKLLTAQYVDRYRFRQGLDSHDDEVNVITFESQWQKLSRKHCFKGGARPYRSAFPFAAGTYTDIPCVEQVATQMETILTANTWLYKIPSYDGEPGTSLESFDQKVKDATEQMAQALSVFQKQEFDGHLGELRLCMRLVTWIKENLHMISSEDIVSLTKLYTLWEDKYFRQSNLIATTLIEISRSEPHQMLILDALGHMTEETKTTFYIITSYDKITRTANSSPEPALRRTRRYAAAFFNEIDDDIEDSDLARDSGSFRAKKDLLESDSSALTKRSS